MQDWEWVVADPNRIDEYLDAYKHAGLSDDESFTLMEMLIQAFEELDAPLETEFQWHDTLLLLEQNIDLHAYSDWLLV
jgi:hypothetical protein